MRKRRVAVIWKGIAIRYFAPFVAAFVAFPSDSLRASGTQLGGQGQSQTPVCSGKAGKGMTGAAAFGVLECQQAKKHVRLTGLPAPLSLRDRYVSRRKSFGFMLHTTKSAIPPLYQKGRAGCSKPCSFFRVSLTGRLHAPHPTFGSMPSTIEDDHDCAGRDDSPRGTDAKRQRLEPAIANDHAFSTNLEPHHISGDRDQTCPPPSAAEGNAASVAPTNGGDGEKDKGRGGEQMENKTSKRKDYLSWDEYFMSVAFLSAMRSKDPSTQVGACIVNRDNRIVGIGYNGFPKGCSDDVLPWARQAEDELDTKYPYVCHAEMNAILNKNSADVKGCTIYVALFPCNECAKLIIQSGIEEVVYLSDKYRHTTSMRASRRLFDMSGVRYRQYVPTRDRVTIDFSAVPR